jgi:hypothetical protein
MLQDDSGMLRLHDDHDEGRMLLLHVPQQHPDLLLHVLTSSD